MNIRKRRIYIKGLVFQIIFIFNFLFQESRMSQLNQIGRQIDEMQTRLEICEEIKKFENEKFSIFDEIKKKSANDDVSLLILNKGNYIIFFYFLDCFYSGK